ncbi:hypothetical protein ACYZT7_21090 [Pseudomonas sp. RT4P38]
MAHLEAHKRFALLVDIPWIEACINSSRLAACSRGPAQSALRANACALLLGIAVTITASTLKKYL